MFAIVLHRDVDDPPFEHGECITLVLGFPQLLLRPPPHIFLWVEIWGVGWPRSEKPHPAFLHCLLCFRGVHDTLSVEQKRESETPWESSTKEGVPLPNGKPRAPKTVGRYRGVVTFGNLLLKAFAE